MNELTTTFSAQVLLYGIWQILKLLSITLAIGYGLGWIIGRGANSRWRTDAEAVPHSE
jgi:hypothetical protein